MNIAVACQSPLSYFSWICADMWKTFANLQKSGTLNNLCDSRRIFDNSWESLIILKDPGCDIPQGSFRCFGILGRQSPDGLSILIGWIEVFRDFESYRMIAFGGAMVLIMIFRPRGILATRKPTITLSKKS